MHINARSNLLNEFEQALKENDKIKCIKSSALINYPACVSEGFNNDYLNTVQSVIIKKMIAQIRMLNKFCNRIVIKNKTFVFRDLLACEFCNQNELNLMYWLCECPLLNEVRYRLNVIHLDSNN